MAEFFGETVEHFLKDLKNLTKKLIFLLLNWMVYPAA